MNKFASLFLLIPHLLLGQKFENVALTPPMGWNSWNMFETHIDEKLIRETTDALLKNGYKEAGYNYIVLDDGWMAKERDSAGNIVADPKKFPSGINALADYVHARGFKLGIYSCAGATTCAGYPGSRGHEYQDALQYASWGVDYLKYDWCDTDKLKAESAYITMRDALKAAKRPIVFSICEWGDNQPWLWGKEVGHLWRISGDITPCWDCELDHGTWSSWGVMRIVRMRRNIRQYGGPGHWNDLDMMEVGNGLTPSEDRAHFSLWCLLSSPLILGNDVRKASKETVDLLTNKELISVNQDSLGIQALKYLDKDFLEVWAKPLSKGDWAICFLNRSDKPLDLQFDWSKHKIKDEYFNKELTFSSTYLVKDLIKHISLSNTSHVLKEKIASHDVLVVRLTPIK